MSDVAGLITKISTRRQELDQTFFNELREMRTAPSIRRWPRFRSNMTPSPSQQESGDRNGVGQDFVTERARSKRAVAPL
jgi:hypothetical protein